MTIAAAVIAGGAGKRLGGVSKAFVTVGSGPIAAQQLHILRDVFARVLVVVGDDAGGWEDLDVELVRDQMRGAGPLGGVHAALAATADCAGVVCVACDMPFLSPALLRALRDRDPAADAVAPRLGGRAEPLLARYGRSCLPVIEGELAAGRLALHAVLAAVVTSWIEEPELRALDPQLRSLININTADDLIRAQAASAPRR
jgi:molybdopterin-guanine dinucleotide biosynthesis protein A